MNKGSWHMLKGTSLQTSVQNYGFNLSFLKVYLNATFVVVELISMSVIKEEVVATM